MNPDTQVYSLRQLRKLSDLTVEQIAKAMQTTPRTIYLWENGESAISAINLQKLMALYRADALVSQIDKLITKN